MFANQLAREYPKLRVEADRIYIQDGRLYTSAGVTAGMDLALALLDADLGSALALQVARNLYSSCDGRAARTNSAPYYPRKLRIASLSVNFRSGWPRTSSRIYPSKSLPLAWP
jgi:transcriptional regulator GlxA family with amidase domain